MALFRNQSTNTKECWDVLEILSYLVARCAKLQVTHEVAYLVVVVVWPTVVVVGPYQHPGLQEQTGHLVVAPCRRPVHLGQWGRWGRSMEEHTTYRHPRVGLYFVLDVKAGGLAHRQSDSPPNGLPSVARPQVRMGKGKD